MEAVVLGGAGVAGAVAGVVAVQAAFLVAAVALPVEEVLLAVGRKERTTTD